MILLLVLSTLFFVSIKLQKLHNIKPIYLVLLYMLLLLILRYTQNKEGFSILENKIIGISGPSTIDSLQKIQDKEIQTLENLYNTLHKVYKKKEDKIKADKYKNIPIITSCKTVGKTDTFNTDLGYNQNLNPISNIKTDMTASDFVALQQKLNSSN
jgi:hypothetical protein